MSTSRYLAVSLSGLQILLLAVTPTSALPVPSVKLSLDFNVPDRGAPSTTSGGGTRGRCLPGTKTLMPLVPKTNLGLTTSDRPSFFAYIPPISRTAPVTPNLAEFLLLSDDDQEVVYQATFPLPDQAGIVQYDLPEDAPALKPGSRYHWYITLSCDTSGSASSNPSAEGWIERAAVSPNLTKALKAAEPSKRAAVYAEAGIWHETLTTLADLRRRNPNSATVLSDWRSVLKSVGLESMADEPIASCR